MSNRRILTEENQKLENVWRAYSSKIYKLCNGWSESPESADDLFQEVALKFCKSARFLNLEGSLYQWFSTVIRNTHHDLHRRHVQETPMSHLSDSQAIYEVFPQSASVHYHDGEKMDRVQSELEFLMSDLTPAERKTVELTYIHGFTLLDVCEMHGLERSLLVKHRQSALLKMRQMKDDRDVFFKKNDAPALVLEDLLT